MHAFSRSARLTEAAAYALKIHAEQQRKGTNTPTISHLLSVAGLVLECGGDEEQAIAGLLHDAVEDCGARQDQEISRRFGPRVAAMLRACSDSDSLPRPPRRAGKEAYLRHPEQANPEVLRVSCCDKLHNARAILSDLRTCGRRLFDRFNEPREATMWYYAALAELFARRLSSPLSRELAITVGGNRAARGNRSHPVALSETARLVERFHGTNRIEWPDRPLVQAVDGIATSR